MWKVYKKYVQIYVIMLRDGVNGFIMELRNDQRDAGRTISGREQRNS